MSSLEHILNKGGLAEHLMKIADHLEYTGWQRGMYGWCTPGHPDAHCAIGATDCASRELETAQGRRPFSRNDVARALGFNNYSEVITWNDHPDTHQSLVMDRFRQKAIELAKST